MGLRKDAPCFFVKCIGSILATMLCIIALRYKYRSLEPLYMHKITLNILTYLLLALPFWGNAQSADQKWAASVGFTYLTYKSNARFSPLQYSFYDPGVSVTVDRYLSGAFAFSTRLLVAPNVHFPVSVESSRPSYLVDMGYQLIFKLNNGAILREQARIAPYLIGGIGGSYTENNPDVYTPLGGGIQVRMTNRIALRLQSVRKISLNKDYQHTAHAMGLVYEIGGKKRTPEPAPVDSMEILAALIDTDGDGIRDDVDQCPGISGTMMNFGCPDSVASPVEATAVIEVAGKDNEHQEPEVPSIIPEDMPMTPQELIVIENTPDNISEQVPVLENSETSIVSTMEVFATPVADGSTTLPDEQSVDLTYLTEPVGEKESDTRPCGMDAVANLTTGINAVYFDLGSDQLQGETQQTLTEVASVLNTCSEARLVVYGHADALGQNDSNLILSVMRAFNVKYYLVQQHGISQSRITSEGYGEDKPAASNETSSGRGLNRRVDFEILYN